LLVGRVLLGWIFVQSGWAKLWNMSGFAASMPRRGIPEFMGYIGAPVEFFGGLAILLGFGTRYAALLILLFTIVASFSTHAYWTFPEAQRGAQHTQFWKNTSMKGGLLLLFVVGAGRWALDWILFKRK
jgi:putative oxidoreductase